MNKPLEVHFIHRKNAWFWFTVCHIGRIEGGPFKRRVDAEEDLRGFMVEANVPYLGDRE